VALNFAKNEFELMRIWDGEKRFPLETLKKVAELGFGGIYVEDYLCGSNLKQLDASILFEVLSIGCVSTTAYLSIHK
jgi:isobutyryl-CoA dehydrogenase